MGLLVRFSRARLYFFTGSHFALMDEPVNSLAGEKLWACIKVNRRTNRLIGRPHLFTYFLTQVSPHYIQLDPIYYVQTSNVT